MADQEQGLEQPSTAKQAEDKAFGHVAALSELAKEYPAGTRTDEDEKYLRELASEGNGLRIQAREAQPTGHPVTVDQNRVVLREKEQHEVEEEAHVGGRVG